MLVLGIVGLFTNFMLLPFVSPIAWYLGAKARREMARHPGVYSDSGKLTAGVTLGVIGTVFALLGVIMLIVGMFVRQFVSPDRLDPEWLRVHGAVLFDPPRSFEPPRLLDQDAQAFRLSGLAYEKSIVEALLYVTMDTVPGIRILSGHGELGETETIYMEDYLRSHHFEVTRVNLLSGDSLSPDAPVSYTHLTLPTISPV